VCSIELGWQHFIVQPKHFVSGFCNGVCPTPLDSEEISDNLHHEVYPIDLRLNHKHSVTQYAFIDMTYIVRRCLRILRNTSS